MMRLRLIACVLALLAAGGAWGQTTTPPSQVPKSFALNGPNVPGRAYMSPIISAAPTGQALSAANRLFATPLYTGSGSVLKSLSFNISTGNAAAWNARMCVYADSGNGLPGALIPSGDTGTVAIGSGSVTGIQTATLNGSNGVGVSGWIWLAFMADNSGESLYGFANGIGTQSGALTQLLGANSIGNWFSGTASNGVFMAQTFGACPGTFGAVTYNVGATMPAIVAGF
jgi:hypothetical protein